MKNQAFLIAAHYTSEKVIELYSDICDAMTAYWTKTGLDVVITGVTFIVGPG